MERFRVSPEFFSVRNHQLRMMLTDACEACQVHLPDPEVLGDIVTDASTNICVVIDGIVADLRARGLDNVAHEFLDTCRTMFPRHVQKTNRNKRWRVVMAWAGWLLVPVAVVVGRRK